MKNSIQIILALASAILLILSFPTFSLEFLAWVGLIPLFFVIENQKPFKAFLIAYLTGVLFFLGTVYWLIHVTLPGMIIVVLYLALYFGFFGLLASHGFSMPNTSFPVFIPALWVVLEWLRSHFLGGFGWCLLGHSQSSNLAIIQVADITGAYGVSFLVALVNVVIFLGIKNFMKGNRALISVAIPLFLIFICVSYGIFRLKNIFTGESLKIAIVQGNIPQAKKWDFNFREEILNKYESLTRDSAKEGVDLIIWPETSVPGYLESESALLERITSLVKAINTPVLIGSPREDRALKEVYYNSAILFAGDGRVSDRYDKIHLVPFGEYVPFRKIFSFVDNFAPSPIGDFTSGKDYTVFKFFIDKKFKDKELIRRLVKKVRFSCLICFEDIFPDLTRQFVKKGADLLVNITNDAWFGKTSAPYQHAQSSVFRAIENRVNVVRAANTGLSCFINQKGQIIGAVEVNGANLFIDGFKMCEITLSETKTFYSTYGDIFAYICIFYTLFYIFNRRRGKIS